MCHSLERLATVKKKQRAVGSINRKTPTCSRIMDRRSKKPCFTADGQDGTPFARNCFVVWTANCANACWRDSHARLLGSSGCHSRRLQHQALSKVTTRNAHSNDVAWAAVCLHTSVQPLIDRTRSLSCRRFDGHQDWVFHEAGGRHAETEVQSRVQAWSMSAGMTAQLVADASLMAVWRRGRPDAVLHHFDQGSQYTSEQFQQLMADNCIICSMSRSGNV